MRRLVGMILTKSRDSDGRNPGSRGAGSYTPIASKYRFIDFPLSNMVNAGIKNIGVVIDYNAQKLAEHLGSGKDWGLERNVNGLFLLPSDSMTLHGQEAPNDLRDLLKNIDFLMNLKEDYVLVSGCNFIANIDYESIFQESCMGKCDLLMLYTKNTQVMSGVTEVLLDKKGKFSGINFVREGDVVENLFMDTYYIRKDILIQILRTANRTGVFSFHEMVNQIRGEIKTAVYQFEDFSFYVDTPKRYYDANMAFLNPKVWREVFYKERRQIYTKNSDFPPTVYGKEAQVENSLLSSGDRINGTVKNSVIFRNVQIAEGALIENSIIGDNVVIEQNVHLKNIIIEADCRISKETTLISSVENPMVIT